MNEQTIKKWGGKRPGSGRKPKGLKTITVRMSPVLQGLIRLEADRLGMTISAYVSRAVVVALLQGLETTNPLSGIPHHGAGDPEAQSATPSQAAKSLASLWKS